MPVLEKREYEIYCQGIASGKKIYDAYRDAYPSVKRNVTARTNARRLEREKPEILARIAELRQENAEVGKWNREKGMDILIEIAEKSTYNSDRIKAVIALNEMTGITAEDENKNKNQLSTLHITLNMSGKK